MSSLWAAPFRTDPVDATVSLPGSKSQTNRALVLSALAEGPSRLSRPLESRDTLLMADALRALGATVTADGDVWTVEPLAPGARDAVTIDVGLAGTVMRFVPPVAALVDGPVTFDGDLRARERPMATTITSLRSLGVRVDDDGRATMPFTVAGVGHVAGGTVTIDASASSQFLSALLLAGARYEAGVDVRHDGPPVPSMPHVAMTLTELRRRGVTVDDSAPGRWTVAPGPVAAYDTAIEPDLSNAGAFIAGALVTAGRVRVQHWPRTTDQAGDRWREIATAFGADVTFEGDDLVVSAPRDLRGITLDLRDEGELTPVVAAVAALATEPSRLTGIAHLRGHETDRLAALSTEITRMGGAVDQLDDGLVITPRPLHGAALETYEDHRMAHAAAVLGLAVKDTQVHDIATTAKTYPGFAQAWERFVS
ncbi:3-phosphoshikimate 1-carboxyvinyltransferase [Mumia zhuanghuii]|uniref:3-phosphoshikimate 1-carboxyvinyltransferase n=1 Tax=Mumia zhuanghuii TaxID=2585211 RepID=A0A5C4MJL1_9ACTN|nr:3-phosphoshikimate 1-carboxyvinyltransferase [Mumia zhuanghuii]TNC42906.1 3-phosphoshikimate 1-carboxyvinyltransferase [Mumia zhuanghuii]TNC50682.1 3-phosphoshikimate 1-carboxyvinyltransferase [Mumia zhuanghuii]